MVVYMLIRSLWKEFYVPRFRGLLEELGLFVNVIGIVPEGVPIDCFIVPASPAYQCNSFRASYVVLHQMAPKAKQLLERPLAMCDSMLSPFLRRASQAPRLPPESKGGKIWSRP